MAAGFAATEGQPLGSSVVVGNFTEVCLDAMACSQLAPNVMTITWGDGTTSTPPACNINTNTPGSSCWITESCAPPAGCTFTLFAPGHVYAEEGPVTGSWGDGSPATACGPASGGDPCVIRFSAGAYSLTASHAYAAAGSYSPTVLINDRGGSQTEAHATISVSGAPPGPLSASVVASSTSGPAASVTIACQGPSGETCSGTAEFSVNERKRGATVVAVSASKRTKGPTTTATLNVGSHSFALAAGQRATLQIGLNAGGRRLLAKFYRLPARWVLVGVSGAGQTVTFSYPRITSIVAYTIEFTKRYSTVQDLSITALPRGSQVTLFCSGRGCPFRRRVVRSRGSQVSLTGMFAGAHLAPRTRLAIAITAVNRVGKVLLLTIQSDAEPAQVVRCQPPGARGPQVCA